MRRRSMIDGRRVERGQRGRRWALVGIAAMTAAVVPVQPSGAAGPAAARTERVTSTIDGGPLTLIPAAEDPPRTHDPVVSADGRFVAFSSDAENIVADDLNEQTDVFVVDRLRGEVEVVSVSSSEVLGDGSSGAPSISDDGRFVAFESAAGNLDPLDGTASTDVFVRDRLAGTTELISVDSNEVQSSEHSREPSISGDGTRVAYQTNAHFAGDTNARTDIYLRDLGAGTTQRVSLTHADGQADETSRDAQLDRDGGVVVFESFATDLVPGDTNGETDVFVRDLTAGTTERVSVASNGSQLPGSSERADISGDGNEVVFETQKPNDEIVVSLRDRTLATSEQLSPASFELARAPTISADGDRVAFGLSNPTEELDGTRPVVLDRSDGSIRALFARRTDQQATFEPVISGNGRYVVAGAWEMLGSDDPGDTADEDDIYIEILADNVFDDVAPGHTFFEEISWLVDEGITTGFDDGTFRSTIPVTRQATAAFLYRIAGEPAFVPPVVPTFTDVGPSAPFFAEIEWAASVGLVDGFPDGTFRPTIAVTRQGNAAFLYRVAGEPPFTPPAVPTFNDVGADHPFVTEIEWLASVGLAKGFDDGGFHPASVITRQALAAFLFRVEWLGL